MQPVSENILHYIWQHRLLQGPLATNDGQPLRILHPGNHNTDGGPDFTDARLIIGTTLWAGNIEIHTLASDWQRHAHNLNRAYDNVILHAVYVADTPITIQGGRPIPTLTLAPYIPATLLANSHTLLTPSQGSSLPCAPWLSQIPEPVVHAALERLLVERLETKCTLVRSLLDESQGNWEQCCYLLVARYFGAPVNALPFQLLAQATPQSLLARWRDQPQRLEALLLGQAGLLQGYFSDSYPRSLQADYQAIAAASSLHSISPSLWQHLRLRPAAFPAVRISQFAQLISRSHSLFSSLLDTTDPEDLTALFDVQASPYWDNHYRIDHPSPGSPKRVGTPFIHRLLINAWAPLLFQYGTSHDDQSLKDRAIDLLHALPAERPAALRPYIQAGLVPRSAAHSQALLQLSSARCHQHQCLNCQIGYKIITK